MMKTVNVHIHEKLNLFLSQKHHRDVEDRPIGEMTMSRCNCLGLSIDNFISIIICKILIQSEHTRTKHTVKRIT